MLCYVVTCLPIWSHVKSPGKEILWKTVALITSLSENAEKFNVFVAAKNLHISTLQWQIQKQHKFLLPLRVGYFISFFSALKQFKNSYLKKNQYTAKIIWDRSIITLIWDRFFVDLLVLYRLWTWNCSFISANPKKDNLTFPTCRKYWKTDAC